LLRVGEGGNLPPMKTQLFVVCAALALGAGCATHTGGTADEDGVVYGSTSYYSYPGYPHRDMMGMRGMEVWKQPSPSGNDIIEARPEIRTYYYH
jgi:hypothetical protein